jgi:putative transposase
VAAFIASQREAHGVPHAVSCRALGVSQSWFYKREPGLVPPSARRRDRLKAEVAARFAARGGKEGAPRITSVLREDGWRVSENTVAGLLRQLGLFARPGRRGRRGLTRPGKGRWRAEDLVQRKFAADGVNRRWYGDGTEVATGEGKLYLSVTWNPSTEGTVGRRPSSPARIPM